MTKTTFRQKWENCEDRWWGQRSFRKVCEGEPVLEGMYKSYIAFGMLTQFQTLFGWVCFGLAMFVFWAAITKEVSSMVYGCLDLLLATMNFQGSSITRLHKQVIRLQVQNYLELEFRAEQIKKSLSAELQQENPDSE